MKKKILDLINAIGLEKWTSAQKDLFWLCFISIVLLIPTIYFDVFDVFVHWYVKVPEPFEFEEVIPVMLILPFCLAVFSWRRWKELKTAQEEIRTLEGILPICASCKRIEDDGQWHQVDEYIRSHTGVEFSHGVCPDCFKKLYPELAHLYPAKDKASNG
jgi:hypothetical protein